MPRGKDSEMKKEYRFAGGTRGRFSGRFTAEEGTQLVDKASRQDLDTWIAEALLKLQALEASLVTYAALGWQEPLGKAAEYAAGALEPGDDSFSKRLQRDSDDQVRTGKHLTERLREIARERSWLVHRGSFEPHMSGARSADILPLIRRLEALAGAAEAIADDLASVLHRRLSKTGLSENEIKRRSDEVVSSWLAADTLPP